MKKIILSLMLCVFLCMGGYAQDGVFKGKIYNAEYDVFIEMNLYEETVRIPGQDILGAVYGYLKKNTDSRVWIIMGVKIEVDGRTATLDIVNDYGSEDLVALLRVDSDGSYTLTQQEGSTMKVAGKGKWIRLPKVIGFTKKRETVK
ncbi:MAG: hypothetical protein MSA13_05265 [Prevotella sp.]|nr:hypothetical protein [Prevotella sp.]